MTLEQLTRLERLRQASERTSNVCAWEDYVIALEHAAPALIAAARRVKDLEEVLRQMVDVFHPRQDHSPDAAVENIIWNNARVALKGVNGDG